jgi:microcystin-dependent protein
MSTNPESEISQALATNMPVGSVSLFAGVLDTASITALHKLGWFPCDGTRLETKEYSELFAVIRHSHGGAGEHFHVPDLRGRFVRGVDAGTQRDPDASTRIAAVAGGNQGDRVGSLQRDELRSHSHAAPHLPSTSHWAVDEANKYDVAQWNSGSKNTESTGGKETRPVNLALNFIIRFRPI